jgi:hypothetical protein
MFKGEGWVRTSALLVTSTTPGFVNFRPWAQIQTYGNWQVCKQSFLI